MIDFPYTVEESSNIEKGVIVLFNRDELSENSNPNHSENVQLFDHDGEVVWTVNGMNEIPYWKKYDSFVGINERSTGIQLVSFSGNSFDLDVSTGRVTFSHFHK